jgi:hypothetical protein
MLKGLGKKTFLILVSKKNRKLIVPARVCFTIPLLILGSQCLLSFGERFPDSLFIIACSTALPRWAGVSLDALRLDCLPPTAYRTGRRLVNSSPRHGHVPFGPRRPLVSLETWMSRIVLGLAFVLTGAGCMGWDHYHHQQPNWALAEGGWYEAGPGSSCGCSTQPPMPAYQPTVRPGQATPTVVPLGPNIVPAGGFMPSAPPPPQTREPELLR